MTQQEKRFLYTKLENITLTKTKACYEKTPQTTRKKTLHKQTLTSFSNYS